MEIFPGFDEMIREMVATLPAELIITSFPPEQRLAGLPPEQRLAGLPPEQRLAGLSPEQQVLALSDEVLRGMSDEYLRTLPAGVQETIRERLGKPAAQ